MIYIVSRFFLAGLQGLINGHAVTCVKWLPGSEDLFIASHEDGTMYVYNKTRQDPLASQSDKDFGKLPHAGCDTIDCIGFYYYLIQGYLIRMTSCT